VLDCHLIRPLISFIYDVFILCLKSFGLSLDDFKLQDADWNFCKVNWSVGSSDCHVTQ
jgi:hypothetical protein